MGFLIAVAVLMLSCVIVGKELCACHGEFYVTNRHIWSIMFCCGAAAICTFYYIYNVANILSRCPQFEVDSGAALSIMQATHMTLSLSYKSPVDGMLRRQSLSIKYDTEEKCLVREHAATADAAAAADLKIESYKYEASRLRYKERHREWLQNMKQQEKEEEDDDLLKFYMLQNEIEMLLEEASRPYDAGSGYSQKNVIPLHTTTVEEDEQFQEDRAAKICRNEQGFGIFLLVLLIICEILYVTTIAVYAWLKSWMPSICPARPRHTPVCTSYVVTPLNSRKKLHK